MEKNVMEGGVMPILMALSPFGVSYGRFSPYSTEYDGLSVVYNDKFLLISIT